MRAGGDKGEGIWKETETVTEDVGVTGREGPKNEEEEERKREKDQD